MSEGIYTSNYEIERQQEEFSSLQAKAAMVLASSALGVGASSYILDRSEKARSILASLPGANRYSKKHDIAKEQALLNGVVTIDLQDIYEKQSVQRSGLSILSSIEELSPMGVLKTLQLSNLLEPFTKMLPKEEDLEVHIPKTSVIADEAFYRNLLNRNGVVLEDRYIDSGFVLKGSKLYAADSSGKAITDEILLNHAKLTTSHIRMGTRLSPNRVLQKYAEINDAKIGASSFTLGQTVVVGDNNKARFAFDWLRAYFRQGMEIGYKSMDNPLGGLEDILKATGVEHLPFAESSFYRGLKSKLQVNLGTGGIYNLSTRDSLKLMAGNMVTKLGGGYLAYQGLNHIMHNATDENSIWHNGVLSGMAHIYGDTRESLAKVIADPFQNYKKNQEYIAEDSTDLLTLAGMPMAGALTGASISYYKRLYNSAKDGMEQASEAAELPKGHGIVDGLFKRLGIGDTASYRSNAIKGALLGGMLALPFLPGALIGDSSEELAAKYSGEKRVENRSNRWWIMGGNRYEGDHIKNFQSSFVHRLKENPDLQAKYGGDLNLKLEEDALYSPLKFLRNPYRREERTQDESPYPVWGMEVSTGSFLGRLFQSTLGELIKPTIINPNIEIGEEGSSSSITSNETGGYSVNIKPTRKDQKLIRAGMMESESDAYVNQFSQPLKKATSALGDFVGLKGFVATEVLDQLGVDVETSHRQLARSGQATSFADTFRENNMGDLLGIGEFQRRLVPTSAASKQETINPLENTIAPSWLPSDESKYYINFKKGDYWKTVQNAAMRLPGEGYASLNPELRGVNPEDYPLVHKYRILSDVARGSEEQISMRRQVMKKVSDGDIVGSDRDLFLETLEEERQRSVKKRFNEKLTEEEKSKLNLTGRLLNTLWETTAYNAENPLEAMSPFRPAAKFVHQRTAAEDYNMTMLQGPDTGIWTNPFSHFSRVAYNRSKDMLVPGINKPIESQERDELEEYFDKLAYMKARRTGNINDALKTTVARGSIGVNSEGDLNKFRAGLSNDQKAYVDSFASETNEDIRTRISGMLPEHISKVYQGIWKNIETVESAVAQGLDAREELKKAHIEGTKSLVKRYGMSFEETEGSLEESYRESIKKRLEVADIEAESFVKAKTGVPKEDWIGWDSRLSMEDVKLRTLTIGKADIHKFGFWKPDQARNERITALDEETEITSKYKEIRRILKEENIQKEAIRLQMREKGIVAKNIEISDSTQNDVRLSIKKEE